MAEYIEREEAKQYLADEYAYAAAEVIDRVPAADVVEVVHASWKWGYQNGQYGIWCTNCGGGWTDSENVEWIAHSHAYCGICGAKMDSERRAEE